MLKIARNLVKQNLSPRVFHWCSSHLWKIYYYWPHKVVSSLIRRNVKVVDVADGDKSGLVRQLHRVNTFAPTRMCSVMTKYGSDKGKGFHTYTTVYSALLGDRRNEPLRIFELGLGTNDPRFAYNMGIYGKPGASLRGWRELFPAAQVYGADIDRGILFEEDRIKTFYCDQLDSVAIRDLWSQPALQGGMDIIVDDGLHTFEANLSFLKGSLEQLRPGGVYFVEDIPGSLTDRWHVQLSDLRRWFPEDEFALLEMPNLIGDLDFQNNLLIVHRRGQAI